MTSSSTDAGMSSPGEADHLDSPSTEPSVSYVTPGPTATYGIGYRRADREQEHGGDGRPDQHRAAAQASAG